MKRGGLLVWLCACYPHGDGGPRATPSAAFWQEILHRRTPCAHQAKSCTQHVRRQYRLLTCLPILPLISPPGSSVVTSPRAPRQFPFPCDCLGRSSWGRPGRPPKTRPARVPPSPPPMSLSPFHLQASPIHAGLFSSSVHLLPCPHATSHCVFPHQSHPSRISAQLQLSSAQLGSCSHISSMFLLCGRHGTAGQAKIYS
ncbi:hypothetical protein F5883DRAFT_36938 [Diaporthe sp. PMI_573]|nr:hypothetical protein F5883DRAFT_36938 [Diaporthaceae sp. PMI_573]